MKGLLTKEFLGFKKNIRSYIPMFLIFAIIGLVTKNTIFISMMLGSLTLGQVMNSFAYDDRNGWDKFILTTAIPKGDIVKSKYVFSLTILAITFFITTIVSCLVSLMTTGVGLKEVIIENYATFFSMTIIVFAMMPLIYKFGIERARNYTLPVWGGLMVGFILALKLADWYNFSGIFFKNTLVLFLSSLVFLFIISITSYRISLDLYGKKDF